MSTTRNIADRTHTIQIDHKATDGKTTRLRITFGYAPATPADLFFRAMPEEAWCDAVHIMRGDYWFDAEKWWDWGCEWIANNMDEIRDCVERDLEFTVFLEAGVTPGLASAPMQGNA